MEIEFSPMGNASTNLLTNGTPIKTGYQGSVELPGC